MPKVIYKPNLGLYQTPGEGFEVRGTELSADAGNFSQIAIQGGFFLAPVTFFNDATLTDENMVFANAVSGAMILSLPDASENYGRFIGIKKIDVTGFNVTISPVSGQLIDNQAYLIAANPHDSFFLLASGSNWFII